MNKAKALLDSLMGPSRDVSLKSRTGEDFKESKVCKCYLMGFCPTSVLGKRCEFQEPCTLLHSIALKEEFERHPQVEKYRREYEDAFLRKLEEICGEADARGAREKRKCRPRETIVKIPEHLKLKMQAYEEARREKLREAEEKGSQGDVAGSQEAVKSAEQCQKDIDGITKAHTSEFPGEEVCSACGVRYLIGRMGEARGYERLREGDIWEEDHKASKVHEGYVEIRQKLAELRQLIKKRREERSRDRDGRGKDCDGTSRRTTRRSSRSKSRSRRPRSPRRSRARARTPPRSRRSRSRRSQDRTRSRGHRR